MTTFTAFFEHAVIELIAADLQDAYNRLNRLPFARSFGKLLEVRETSGKA